MIQPHLLAKTFFVKFEQVWLDLCEIKLNLGKFEAKFGLISGAIRLNLGKIKILHPQKHSIFYGYGQV